MIISLHETCSSVWLERIYCVSLSASTFIKDDISYGEKKGISRQKLKCKVSSRVEGDESDDFSAYPLSACEKGNECGTKHQSGRTTKNGVKRFEIFSRNANRWSRV